MDIIPSQDKHHCWDCQRYNFLLTLNKQTRTTTKTPNFLLGHQSESPELKMFSCTNKMHSIVCAHLCLGDDTRFGWKTDSACFSFSGLAFKCSEEVTSPQVEDEKFEGLLHTVNIERRLVESYWAQQGITRNALSAQWSFSCRPQRCCNLTGKVTFFRLFDSERRKTPTLLETFQWQIIKCTLKKKKHEDFLIQ